MGVWAVRLSFLVLVVWSTSASMASGGTRNESLTRIVARGFDLGPANFDTLDTNQPAFTLWDEAGLMIRSYRGDFSPPSREKRYVCSIPELCCLPTARSSLVARNYLIIVHLSFRQHTTLFFTIASDFKNLFRFPYLNPV